MHSAEATELQANAQIAMDQSTVVGVIVALPTWIVWVLSTVHGQEVCCCREVGCDLTDLLQIFPVDPSLCLGGVETVNTMVGSKGGDPNVCGPWRSEWGLFQLQLCIRGFCLWNVRV